MYIKNPNVGTFTVGVHKRNASPKNHCQNIPLNDNYIYEIIYLLEFFLPLNSHRIFNKNHGDFCDLND
jgi:hypothetical protein